MKKSLLFFALLSTITLTVDAQWQPVSIPGVSTPVSTVHSFFSANVFAGTRGDGIFYTSDYGDTWTDISSNIGNKDINFVFGDIDGEISILSGTLDGAYVYSSSTGLHTPVSEGLENNDITYFGIYTDYVQYMLGTNGGGVFLSPVFNYSWSAFNNGLSGDALVINTAAYYDTPGGNTSTVIGTNNGFYIAYPGQNAWTATNTGLSGEALKVNDIWPLESFVIIATDNGIYVSFDLTQGWMPLLQGVRINKLVYDDLNETFLAFGTTNYFSTDIQQWNPMNTGGLPQGEVISAAARDGYIFAVVQNPGKNPANGGSIFRGLASMVVSTDLKPAGSRNFNITNYPNPAVEKTIFNYSIAKQGDVSISITDVSGRNIAIIHEGMKIAGNHQYQLNTANLRPGIYICTLRVNGIPIANNRLVISEQ